MGFACIFCLVGIILGQTPSSHVETPSINTADTAKTSLELSPHEQIWKGHHHELQHDDEAGSIVALGIEKVLLKRGKRNRGDDDDNVDNEDDDNEGLVNPSEFGQFWDYEAEVDQLLDSSASQEPEEHNRPPISTQRNDDDDNEGLLNPSEFGQFWDYEAEIDQLLDSSGPQESEEHNRPPISPQRNTHLEILDVNEEHEPFIDGEIDKDAPRIDGVIENKLPKPYDGGFLRPLAKLERYILKLEDKLKQVRKPRVYYYHASRLKAGITQLKGELKSAEDPNNLAAQQRHPQELREELQDAEKKLKDLVAGRETPIKELTTKLNSARYELKKLKAQRDRHEARALQHELPAPAVDPSMRPNSRLDPDWVDGSNTLIPLEHYPNQQEVHQLMKMLHKRFFSHFESKKPISNIAGEFQFGSKNQYACRLVWLNPQDLVYPHSQDRLLDEYSVNPTEYLVFSNRNSKWRKGTLRMPSPTSAAPNNMVEYIPETYPILKHYLEMRFMAQEREGERWADGMGTMLRSSDNLFALGLRVWSASDPLPLDTGRHIRRVDPLGDESITIDLNKVFFSVRPSKKRFAVRKARFELAANVNTT
ncbi:MAG: hypothetical protein M1831_007520 [Alyxoria varia]|nr:MAG: hypothetical protein M1831_007520 [Alyxoria varia]